MTPGEVRALALIAYGPDWGPKVARSLNVTLRCVRHWRAGTRHIGAEHAMLLAELARSQHLRHIAEARRRYLDTVEGLASPAMRAALLAAG